MGFNTSNKISSLLLASSVVSILVLAVSSVHARFVVEKNSIRVIHPESLRSQHDGAIANFGVPKYGGSMVGSVVYPDKGALGCNAFGGDQPFKSKPRMPTILLLDRGDCYFALKAWNGQQAGAAAVLVADSVDEPLITMDSPEDSSDASEYIEKIGIPSVLIDRSFGESLKAALKKGDEVVLKLDWSESMPHPDERVEYELWTNSNDECGPRCDEQMDFVKNFKGHAQILEKGGYTQFTPHYITWYCPKPFILSSQCVSQCINHGRYCAPDPEQDFGQGYEGKNVVFENLRQLCVHRVANESYRSWVWWDYVTDFHIRCSMKKKRYSEECAEDVMKSLDLPIEKIKKCMGDRDADVENEVLKIEQDLQVGRGSRGDVTILPTLVVNNVQYRGKLERTAVLKAVCAGFKETTAPRICLTSDLETNECLERNGGCWMDSTTKISACQDTFRGRVCRCPLVSGVQFEGDGYNSCQDIDECKEKQACQCDGCTCKNTWGGYDCQCNGGKLYMRPQDTCIARNESKFGWFVAFLVLAVVSAAGIAGYVFYKYRLRMLESLSLKEKLAGKWGFSVGEETSDPDIVYLEAYIFNFVSVFPPSRSRLCVKNLPKNVNEKRLREFFSQKGEVTDAKIMRTKDGNSRQFGFVGYRTEGEAEEAVKYFNNSYLDTSRVVCEIARKVGDPNIPRPWSRYSLQKQENLDEGKKVDSKSGGLGIPIGGKKKSKKGKVDDDPQLQEFLQVMQPRVKSKLWGNDSLTTHVHEQNKKSGNQNTQLKGKETGASVLAQLDDNEKSEPRSLDSRGAEKSSNLAFDEVISDMDYLKSRVKKEWSDSEKSDDEDNSDNSGKDGGKTKLLKMRREHQDIQKVDLKVQRNALEIEASEEEVEEGFSEDPEHEVIDTKKDVLETGRLFVRNLPYTATEDELEEYFRKLGNVSQVHLVIDKDTKRSKGIAYVVYTLPESAARALDELDNSIFQGRLLHVMPAKQKHNSEKQESNAFANESLKTFKQKKQKERKSLEASGNTQAWNSLFMRPDTDCALSNYERSGYRLLVRYKSESFITMIVDDCGVLDEEPVAPLPPIPRTFSEPDIRLLTRGSSGVDTGGEKAVFVLFMVVVENIAREFGISKSDVLDREADDLPVRIALGETKVIAETKKALVNAGVNIASLEELAIGKPDGVKRSDHVILVKNLPYGCSEDELDKMFRKFGSLDKIILPRTRTLALVVFLEPSEARAAFKAKAYKCFKGTPLYLEWAPGNILSQNSKILENTNNAVVVGEHQAKRVLLEQHVEGIVDADVDPDRIESRSLYVKNLNFKTSDASLGKHFSELMKEGKVLSARVKKHSKNGKNVSMGFGFLEFDCVETAVTVCKDLQGTVLDGHALSLQLCHAKNDGKVLKNVDKSLSSTKLMVRNVAFEATEKDLRQLFSPFGEIKSIRLPRRIGHHGGFAFVEFGTKQEADNAVQALSSTHLYGRHLVLERAKERESLEDLRAKTAAQFSDRQDGMSSTKISKKRKHMAVLDVSNVKFRRIAD
ncbi:hypothetical protein RHGRI_005218 [Rhododendron griersonianum]|uniref:RRM domain-containing protein n=1 Tax=Rhododendron griersonianum TaxID=479676 RepID=A0AAV6LDB4_9ERIC|nr:hypothetical protein RHGRI_005218 [Rhododendron griersonianum]